MGMKNRISCLMIINIVLILDPSILIIKWADPRIGRRSYTVISGIFQVTNKIWSLFTCRLYDYRWYLTHVKLHFKYKDKSASEQYNENIFLKFIQSFDLLF